MCVIDTRYSSVELLLWGFSMSSEQIPACLWCLSPLGLQALHRAAWYLRQQVRLRRRSGLGPSASWPFCRWCCSFCVKYRCCFYFLLDYQIIPVKMDKDLALAVLRLVPYRNLILLKIPWNAFLSCILSCSRAGVSKPSPHSGKCKSTLRQWVNCYWCFNNYIYLTGESPSGGFRRHSKTDPFCYCQGLVGKSWEMLLYRTVFEPRQHFVVSLFQMSSWTFRVDLNHQNIFSLHLLW